MKHDPTCVFCKIARGESKADIVLQRPEIMAVRDINPQAPDHVVVFPTEHIASLADCADGDMLGSLMMAAREVARLVNIDHGGYRVVVNNGKHGGQTVNHLHVHVLGGRRMQWPPG